MDESAIREQIKKIIADVAFLDPAEIGDDARFIEDLNLDSLSLLEIGVDVDYAFKLNLSDEKLKELRSIGDSVQLVQQTLGERASESQET